MTVTASELHTGPWTIEDLEGLPDNGNCYEIIEGALVVSPMPAKPHLRAVTRLCWLLKRQAPDEFEVGQCANVYQETRDTLLIPDLWVAAAALLEGDGLGFLPGEADLAVEVVSPRRRGYDFVTKRHFYAGLRIPQYWILDPEAGELHVLRLAGEAYVDATVVKAGTQWRSDQPFPLVLDPADFC